MFYCSPYHRVFLFILQRCFQFLGLSYNDTISPISTNLGTQYTGHFYRLISIFLLKFWRTKSRINYSSLVYLNTVKTERGKMTTFFFVWAVDSCSVGLLVTQSLWNTVVKEDCLVFFRQKQIYFIQNINLFSAINQDILFFFFLSVSIKLLKLPVKQ